eukprot:scaffold7150_cov76-Amphora_coffeaeformis.AAC.1
MAAAVVAGSTAILLHATRVLFECVAAPTTAQSYIFHGGTYAFDAVFIQRSGVAASVGPW